MLTTLISYKVVSQDIQFSQFYAASLYLNPGFAGSTHYDRITVQQRAQWPGLDAKYLTSYFSYDRYFEKYKSGFGAYFLKDWQGNRIVNSTEAALQYSYEVGLSEGLAFRPGLQVGIINRSIDYTNLKYPDQFDDKGLTGQNTNDPRFNSNQKTFADFSAGAVLYSKTIWVSYAVHHLSEPNQSYWSQESELPRKHSLTAGYRIKVIEGAEYNHMGHHSNTFYLIPTAHYKIQGKSDQLDMGLYAFYGELVTGVWYRGIPIKKYKEFLQNNESIVALIGWKIKELRLSYSYDFIASHLRVARTAGAHEINITYIFNRKKSYRRRVLPCPEF